MRRKNYIWIGLALVLLSAGFWVNSAVVIHLYPPTPPLLEGVHASGGWRSEGCPPQSQFSQSQFYDPAHEERNADVEARLNKKFPPGTSAVLLDQELLAQGFRNIQPCANDATIQRAIFQQRGTGFLVYTANATVAWKTDDQNRIVWTKAQLSYDGL